MDMPIVTAADMRRLEQAAVDSGMSYARLMECAGAAVAREIETNFDETERERVLVLCGNGNNGGDGYVIARLLSQNPSCRVTVVNVCGEPKTALARDMFDKLDPSRVTVMCELPSDLTDVTLVVDAIFGIGFRGALPAEVAAVLKRVAAWPAPRVVAVDIPSGMNADDGTFDDDSLCAVLTVTFTALKPAMIAGGEALCGGIVIADVGIPDKLIAQYQTPFSLPAYRIPARPQNGHKGTFGSLLSVCGSYGMAGAAMLSGKAALRSGLGLLHMAVVDSIYPIVASQIWEAVYHPLPQTEAGTVAMSALGILEQTARKATAVLVGCGLSQNEETAALVKAWLPTLQVPIVLDADGLNMFSSHIVSLKAIKAPLIITPHPAEAARLLGITVQEVERDRPSAAKRLAANSGAVTVLKGHRTLIATPQGELFINVHGNSGMATGGSGDVLSGMIAAMCARGASALDAALWGVHRHALAGDAAANECGEDAMLPTDMIEALKNTLS